MAFRTVSGNNGNFKSVSYKTAKEGDILAVGTYLGTKEVEAKGRSFNVHLVRDEKGTLINLPNAGHLDNLLAESVKLGDYIQVTFAGKREIKKGAWAGQMANMFEVAVDDERFADPASFEVQEGSDSTEEEAPSEEELAAARKATAAKAQAAKATTAAAPTASKGKSVSDLVKNYRK